MKRKNFHDFLLNEYSNHLMLKSKNYYDSTKYYIHLIVENSENISINDIDFKYCSDLIVKFKSLKKSTNRLIILLKSVLHFAYDLNLINNISFLKKFKREYKVKRKKVFLEKKELEDVLNFFEQSDKELFYIIKFLTASALRVNDLLEIKFESINENFINFKNHKRNIFCKLILNNELKDIINYQKIKLKSIRENKKNFNKENYLFFNAAGKKYEYHILQHRLLQYKKMRLHVVLISNKNKECLYFEEKHLELTDINNHNTSSIFYETSYSNKYENNPDYVISDYPLAYHDLALTQDDVFVIIKDLNKSNSIKRLNCIFKPGKQNLLKEFNILNEELFIILHNKGYRYFNDNSDTIAELLNSLIKEQKDIITDLYDLENTDFKFSKEKNKNNVALLSFVNKDNEEVIIYVERI